MSRGGRRPGAGRKPKPKVLRFLDGNAGHRKAPGVVESFAPPALVEPPETLAPAELAIWRELAPQATEARTLTRFTVPAFVLLLQEIVDYRELRGRVTRKERPLLLASENELATRREVRALGREIRNGLKDFAVSPFGKEILAGLEPAEDDPLDAFTRRRDR